ncbi:hypothetical protein [Bacillus paranthracis]|uniref:hypothetical protein n=1 Tax=Bacillus paranthracis TaxID=2026186 RepID=UPI0007782E9A|nr:hypothetical protein [Bacillus paranthracis]KXY68742.1 hypothetical protein AT272_18285 [Bacillus cereus]MCU5468831.1 hypothetical protein [Bacillus paranthracis]
MNFSLSKEVKLDRYVYVIFMLCFSMQNKDIFNFILVDLGGLRLNIYDTGIICSLLFMSFRFAYMKKREKSLIDLSLVFLFICFLIIGIANQNKMEAIFYNARSLAYLIMGYWITKSIREDSEFFFKLLGISSFVCSSLYFYNFMTSSDFITGEIHRAISFNLFIILLYICFSIYYFENKSISLISTINIIYGSIAILTSQTRTLIAPLIILLIIFFISLLYSKKVKLKYKLFIMIAGLLSMYIFVFSDISEIGFSRFLSGDGNQESTLDLRIGSMMYNFSNMLGIEWILGGGFGREVLYYSNFSRILMFNYDLELYLAEYIVKYGVLGTVLLNFIYIKILLTNYRYINKKIILGIFIVLGSLSISGLSGYQGHLYLGVVLGIFSNRYIWRN